MDGLPVSLLGVTREPGRPAHERFLEYLWVSPGWRRSGVGFQFFSLVLDRLQAAGVRTVFLWVLDGNEVATRLYRKAGFEPGGKARAADRPPGPQRAAVPAGPGRPQVAAELPLTPRSLTMAAGAGAGRWLRDDAGAQGWPGGTGKGR